MDLLIYGRWPASRGQRARSQSRSVAARRVAVMLQLAELSNRDVMKPGRDQEAKQS
jgi:hypothetical protein